MGGTPEVTWQQKTSSHGGLSFSLLFPDMKSLYIYFEKKKENAHVSCIFVYALAIVNLFKKIFIN